MNHVRLTTSLQSLTIVISSSSSSLSRVSPSPAFEGGGDVRDVPDDVEGSGEEGDEVETCRVVNKFVQTEVVSTINGAEHRETENC